MEDSFSIPPWIGTRSVYDLKFYPLNYCRSSIDHTFTNLEDFKGHVIRRGKEFVKLETINHKYYNGQVVGSRHEFVQHPSIVSL